MRVRTAAVTAVAVLAIPAFAATGAASAATMTTVPNELPNATLAQVTPVQMFPRSPLNTASDRVALNLYATYLGSVLRATWSGQSADLAYISGVSSQCKSALALLTQPNYQVNAAAQATLTAFGEEIGDDLSITFDNVVQTPFAKLVSALERLRWSRVSDGVQIIRHFAAAQSLVLYMTPADLCQDASYAQSNPETIPQPTKNFDKAYARASKQANAALSAVLALMQAYENASEKTVVARISTLAAQISRVTKSDLSVNATALSGVLEST
jgi:hypothetical protein